MMMIVGIYSARPHSLPRRSLLCAMITNSRNSGGKLLRKADKTVENWKKFVEDENPLNIRADDDNPISKTLSLSYDHLPLHLKVCFLYMGIFPKHYDVTHSKLNKLWNSEGFIDPRNFKDETLSLGQMVHNCLLQICANSLVVIRKYSSTTEVKTCRLHFVYRAPCVSKAWYENFFHFLNKLVNSFPQGINIQRRLCVHNKAVVGFKQVQSSMESVSSVRSLLFFGQQDQKPLRVYLGYRLLRVLDALTIHFYEFLHKAVELIHLRYLAITYSGREIPPSISRLKNLEILIVHPHHFTKYPDGPVYLPIEIWRLHRLRHLECLGFDLPDPSSVNDNSIVLEQLLTLFDVSAHSCTKGVLARLPNLMKLGVRIARGLILDVADGETSLDFFGNVVDLCGRIESFSCVVLKPYHSSRLVSSVLNFHVNIRKINLSGCGFGWEYMAYIGRLPNLEVLKLRLYAFRGPEWETVEGGFPGLEFLLLEDLDIEHWRISYRGEFSSLRYLIVKHCYKLREIPCGLWDLPKFSTVEVFDCSPRAYQRLREHKEKSGNSNLDLEIHCSWDEKKLESS